MRRFEAAVSRASRVQLAVRWSKICPQSRRARSKNGPQYRSLPKAFASVRCGRSTKSHSGSAGFHHRPLGVATSTCVWGRGRREQWRNDQRVTSDDRGRNWWGRGKLTNMYAMNVTICCWRDQNSYLQRWRREHTRQKAFGVFDIKIVSDAFFGRC